jgi:DNA-binding NarL/FixJ family response regulator
VGQRADVASGIIILERAPARSLEIAGGGESNKEIGRNLNISAATVKRTWKRFSGGWT